MFSRGRNGTEEALKQEHDIYKAAADNDSFNSI